MKLEKNTKYLLKTRELYAEFLKDAEKQGYRWLSNDAPTKVNYYYVNKERSCIYIDKDGRLRNGSEESMNKYHLHAKCVEYKNIPEIYPMSLGCVGIDAPDFETAFGVIKNYLTNRRDFIDMISEKVYTVRIQDNKTTVITPDGKVATAKCHPDDEFDIVEGFRVALEKIEEQNRKLTQKEKDILNSIIVLGGYSFYIDKDHDLIVEFDNENIYVDIDKDDFKWCKALEDYNPKELLEKYA